jgi:hypothetical protein
MSEQIKSFSLNTIIEKPTPVLQPSVKPQQKKASKVESVINWDDIIAEWSYRLPNGFPTMKNGKFTVKSELKVLQEVLTENGINEMPDFTKRAPAPLQEEEPVDTRAPKTIEDIKKLIPAMKLRGDQINKLYDVIKTFTLYEPIKNTLIKKTQGYEDLSKAKQATKQKIYKEYTNKIKNILEKIGGSALVKFQTYLQDRLELEKAGKVKPVIFPVIDGKGNFQFPEEIEKALGDALASHTGQDEGKKGVGQGELMMTLVYDNISQPAGKGDVFLKGVGELEVKGFGAVLGKGKPEDFPLDTTFLTDFGITKGVVLHTFQKGNTQAVAKDGVWPGGQGASFSKFLIDTYNNAPEKAEPGMEKITKNGFLNAFREALGKSAVYKDLSTIKIAKYITAAAFKDAETLSKHIGVLNFHVYHKEEDFKCFIACDYGSTKAGNSGLYVFVNGSVDDMADKLLATSEAKFQTISANNIKPRIMVSSGPVGELKEDEEWDY